jgi:CubicO group peptidase (beta-lactamase class C family)
MASCEQRPAAARAPAANLRRMSRTPYLLAIAVRAAAALGALAPQLAPQTLPAAKPEAVGMSAQRLDRLTALMQRYVADGLLPGAVTLVARRGCIVYHEAFGFRDRDAQVPMTTDTVFRIASQTKALVSTAVLMLQEEGKLLISDKVDKYLPEFAHTTVAVARDGGGYDVVPSKRAITLRDHLTHTAGLGYGEGPAAAAWKEAGIQGWYLASRTEPVGATVARLASLPFDAQPGERYVYGYSSDVLGVAVERIAGQPLDVFLRERIFAPLGMTDTCFFLPPDQRARLAAVYARTADGKLARAPDGAGPTAQGDYVDGPRQACSGGAGLLSTALDYARFLQAMLDGGALGGARILAPKTVELMTQNHIGDRYPWGAGQGFGLGFRVRLHVGAAGEPGSVGEFGWGGAYHSSYWADPVEQLVVVHLTQVLPAEGLDDHGKLRALVYQAILEPGRAGG